MHYFNGHDDKHEGFFSLMVSGGRGRSRSRSRSQSKQRSGSRDRRSALIFIPSGDEAAKETKSDSELKSDEVSATTTQSEPEVRTRSRTHLRSRHKSTGALKSASAEGGCVLLDLMVSLSNLAWSLGTVK